MEKNYEYHGYVCQSGSVLCRGGNPDPNNPENIIWEVLPTSICSSINAQHPGSMDVPKCGANSKEIHIPGVTMPKGAGMSKQLKNGLIIGGSIVGFAIIAGLVYRYTKKSKSKNK